MTTPGTLYGIGVGPGAPDLLTLRAHRLINSVDVLAIPRPNEWSKSLAFRIIEPNLEENENQEKLFLTFPMSKDPSVVKPYWEKAFEAIGNRLLEGKNVGFVCQGDPFVFSTFIYLFENATEKWPEVPIEVVPAVTSISAVPSAAKRPLVDGMERLAVLPATYGVDDLKKIIREFDSIVLMKVSSVINQVVEIIEDEGLLENSVYVERATSADEKVVYDLKSLKGNRCVYFSMVVITKKLRSGILATGPSILMQNSISHKETEHAPH